LFDDALAYGCLLLNSDVDMYDAAEQQNLRMIHKLTHMGTSLWMARSSE